MRVCTQPLFLVPSWPESSPAQICVCAASILFRPVTVASRTVSSSRLSAEEVLALTFRPSDLRLGPCSQKRAWGSERLALWPWCTVPKCLPQQQGCVVPFWHVVTPPIHPNALSPPPVCGLCSFADRVQPHSSLLFKAILGWPSFGALSRPTSLFFF